MGVTDHFKVVVVGAGPAGLSAALNAANRKLTHLLFERREIGNTIFDYQLGKWVMAEPERLPLRSQLPFKASTREEILEGWNQTLREYQVNHRRAEVTAIKKDGAIFTVQASDGSTVTADCVILGIGVQGTPRRLGVPGEDQKHVAYTLADPKAFKGLSILVVGAGDAAIENALALAEHNTVGIINRSAEFPRAKDANVAKITDAIKKGKVRLFANTTVKELLATEAILNTPDGEEKVPCNHIIARLGGILPRSFLEQCGVNFASKDPGAVPTVDATYQSNVPGLYILGALIGYPLIKQAINQGFEVIEHITGNPVEPADQVLIDEKLKDLPGSPKENLSSIRAALPLFTDLSDAQFRELTIDSTIHQLAPGSVVFKRNDYTDTFWSIVSGEVTIEIGPDRSVALSPGMFFGEMGLLSGRRRVATVRVSKSAVLVETPRRQILKLMSAVPSVKRTIDELFMLRALSTQVFPEVDAQFLKDLVKRCKGKNFKKGDVLFKEGDLGDAVYIIRKGSVKVMRRARNGDEVTHTYVPAGNLVGEMAVLSGPDGKRSATVAAAVACETIVIERADVESVLAAYPTVRRRVEELAERRKIENISTERTFANGAGEVLDFMLREGLSDADNVLVIDSDLCVGCDNCERACAATHQGTSRLDRKGGKSFANLQVPISCRHCENPLCMLDCPPDALTRMPNGEVVIRDSCIGCGNCVSNCPYGVIQLVHEDDHAGFSLLRLFGFKSKKHEAGPAKAAKCDLCQSLPSGPACVRSCPTGAAIRVNPRQIVSAMGGR